MMHACCFRSPIENHNIERSPLEYVMVEVYSIMYHLMFMATQGTDPTFIVCPPPLGYPDSDMEADFCRDHWAIHCCQCTGHCHQLWTGA